jgi:Na+/proline symporter
VVILVIIIIFSLTVYATSDELGSPEAVFNALLAATERHPVEGNAGGSYLTMRSYEGVIFFVINIVGNFGTVFCDAGYFQKAIAANPASALSGYILGGLCWFAIPWLCATTMGLATLSLETNPAFPTYPNRMPDADVSAGLVLPYAAITLLGSGGAAATLLYASLLDLLTFRMVFMAVTSAMSAELIAVSSLWTYDIYKCYWRPNATGKELIAASHSSVVAFAVIMAGFSTGLYYIGISMGYLYLLMGVIISSAVLPITLTLMWKRMNWYAAVFSPILGFAVSVGSWLGTAKADFGELTVASTGSNNPMLVGNVVALLSPIVFVGVLTLIFKPDNYDFESMKAIELDDDDDQLPPMDGEMQAARPGAIRMTREELIAESKQLDRASLIAKSLAALLTICLLVLWPMPMYGTGYIFSLKFFTGWVVVGIMWIFFSLFG